MSDDKNKNPKSNPKQEPKHQEYSRHEKASNIGESKAQQEGLSKASEIRPRQGKPKEGK